MRISRLILLSLILSVVGLSLVYAQDGFYVIPTMKGNYAPVPKTGQTDSYGAVGSDGDLEKGVAWPTPRFTDNNNGTVTDNLTGLIWLKNANALGVRTWIQALSDCNNLVTGSLGLTDGSQVGDWRLPNIKEMLSLLDYGHAPLLPPGHPFTGVQMDVYWSSTSYLLPGWALRVALSDGYITGADKSVLNGYVWPVRDGK